MEITLMPDKILANCGFCGAELIQNTELTNDTRVVYECPKNKGEPGKHSILELNKKGDDELKIKI